MGVTETDQVIPTIRATKFSSENPMERNNAEDPGVYGRIILERI
jgi:hypothetical protein